MQIILSTEKCSAGEQAIKPQQSAIGSLEDMKEMVMRHPPNADD
jgi:hypothetical protein